MYACARTLVDKNMSALLIERMKYTIKMDYWDSDWFFIQIIIRARVTNAAISFFFCSFGIFAILTNANHIQRFLMANCSLILNGFNVICIYLCFFSAIILLDFCDEIFFLFIDFNKWEKCR